MKQYQQRPTALSEKSLVELKLLGGKRKRYTAFTDEERARIGRYAAENGNSAALKKFRFSVSLPDLGKSTVQLFKKYLSLFSQNRQSGEVAPSVLAITSKKCGRPLTLKELDSAVQLYIPSL